jgi:ankyrin repeat protein
MYRFFAAAIAALMFVAPAGADTREMLAALHAGDADAVRAALVAGANPDGETPFIGPSAMQLPVYIAAQAGRADILALLVEFGADVDRRDKRGARPLDSAAEHGDLGIVRLLVEAGATPDPREDDPEVRRPLVIAADRGSVDIALYLLENGANPDPGTDRWGAPLLHAAKHDDIRLAERLIGMGASIAPRDRLSRETPLHRAAAWSTPDMVRLLIRAGAPLDARDWDGETPLFQAAGIGRHEIVAILIEAGAAIDIPDEDGRSALVAALRNRPGPDHEKGIDDPFVPTRDRVQSHWAGIRDRDMDGVARLLAARTSDLDTALAEAVWGGWEEAARILVSRGALVHGRTFDGRAALAGSFFYPGLSMFDLLVEANVDLSLAGAETMHAAAAAGRMDIPRALFAQRWLVDTPDGRGRTALLVAAVEGRNATAAELLALGADPAIRDAGGHGIVDQMKGRLGELIRLAIQREASRAYLPTDFIRGEAARLNAAYEAMLPALGLAEHAGTLMPAEEN